MKKLLWFVVGVAGGVVLAHLIDKDPRGHVLLEDVDARISAFTDRIGDAYRTQEARLGAVVDQAAQAASEAAEAAREAVDGAR